MLAKGHVSALPANCTSELLVLSACICSDKCNTDLACDSALITLIRIPHAAVEHPCGLAGLPHHLETKMRFLMVAK